MVTRWHAPLLSVGDDGDSRVDKRRTTARVGRAAVRVDLLPRESGSPYLRHRTGHGAVGDQAGRGRPRSRDSCRAQLVRGAEAPRANEVTESPTTIQHRITNDQSPNVYQPNTTLGGANEDHYVGSCMKVMVWKTIRIAVAAVIASLLVYCLPGF